MSDILLYQQILGLQAPWQVTSVNLEQQKQSLFIDVELDKNATLSCPKCDQQASHYDSRLRHWRHLDTCQFQTIISAKVPRVKCPTHGCLTISVPWAEGSSRYTELFENFVIQFLKIASISAVSETCQLSWGTIERIMQRAIERGLAFREEVYTEHLLIDETSFKKGHDYVTILSNNKGQVLGVSDGRSSESVHACIAQLPVGAMSQTKSVCMDMSNSYIKGIKEALPDAEKKIAFDHFHVAQKLTEVVDNVRRTEVRTLIKELRKNAYKTRYLWLKNPKNMTTQQQESITFLASHLQSTVQAWCFKEWARDIWKNSKIEEAADDWKQWLKQVKQTGLLFLETVAKTIEEKLWGILNAMRFKTSNALAEAINGKVRQLKVRAMGYRNKERFKQAIMFHFGQLEMFHHKR